MTSEEKKVFEVVKNNPGIYTAEVARKAGMQTSNSKGEHRDWPVYHMLWELEKRGLLRTEEDGKFRRWWVK